MTHQNMHIKKMPRYNITYVVNRLYRSYIDRVINELIRAA